MSPKSEPEGLEIGTAPALFATKDKEVFKRKTETDEPLCTSKELEKGPAAAAGNLSIKQADAQGKYGWHEAIIAVSMIRVLRCSKEKKIQNLY